MFIGVPADDDDNNSGCVRGKLPSPIIDITGDEDTVKTKSTCDDVGNSKNDCTIASSSDVSPAQSTATTATPVPNNVNSSINCYTKTIQNDKATVFKSTRSLVSSGSLVPMEGSVINDWMDASEPIESSSLIRLSSSSLHRQSSSSSNGSGSKCSSSNSSSKNSPSKSPAISTNRHDVGLGAPSDGLESGASSTSLELFTISSSDASMDSSSASVSAAHDASEETQAKATCGRDQVTSRSDQQCLLSSTVSSQCDGSDSKSQTTVQSKDHEVTSSEVEQ